MLKVNQVDAQMRWNRDSWSEGESIVPVNFIRSLHAASEEPAKTVDSAEFIWSLKLEQQLHLCS